MKCIDDLFYLAESDIAPEGRRLFGAAVGKEMIDLRRMYQPESGIYDFGKRTDMVAHDVKSIARIFAQDTQDRHFLMSKTLSIGATDLLACSKTSILHADEGDGQKYPHLHYVKIFVKRDAENAFVGFVICGSPVDAKEFRNLKILFVDAAFRRKGQATLLLAHAYHYLQSKNIRVHFRSYKENPACALYDRLVGFKRKDAIFGDLWIYKQIKSED